MKRFCTNCGTSQIDGANFCPSCGQAVPQMPPAEQYGTAQQAFAPIQPTQPEHHQLIPDIKVKQTKRKKVIGMIMLCFGAFRFVGNIILLSFLEKPSVFDYSIYGNEYDNALQLYQIAKVVGAIGILFYLVLMIVGIIIIVNLKKTKEQQ